VDSEFVVHVVDDDEAVRRSLMFLLSVSGYASRAHASATDFAAASSNLTNGCLVTDLRMPDMDGLELLRLLRAQGNPMPVIIVTGQGDVQAAVEAMKAGASDFIEKPFSEETLLTMITNACMDAKDQMHQRQRHQLAREKIESLSQRERQVLDGVVEGKSNKMIALALELSPRTVEVYRATIMAKTNTHNLAELVRLAIQASAR
jgi:two-component system response regulator FixJ